MKLKRGSFAMDEQRMLGRMGIGLRAEADAYEEHRAGDFTPDGGGRCSARCKYGVLTLETRDIRHSGRSPLPAEGGGRSFRAMRVRLALRPDRPCELFNFSVRFHFLADRRDLWRKAESSFHWIPGMKRKADDVVGDHLFRSPVAVLSAGNAVVALIPALEGGKKAWSVNRYLDMEFDDTGEDSPKGMPPVIEYGVSRLKLSGHVYFQPEGRPFAVGAPGIALSFYLLAFDGYQAGEALHAITSFIWNVNASRYERSVLPQTVPFSTYAKYGNGMAMQYLWETGPSPDSGGICLTTFRRDDGVMRGREYSDDIWFHAWFNNMRTAMELAYFGGRSGKPEWAERARAIARCLLAAPQQEGVFPTIYAPHDGGWIASSEHGGGKRLYSIPDCAWAALWLRKYSLEYGSLPGTEEFLGRFRSFLCRRQDGQGGFPCWVSTDGLVKDTRLDNSAAGALAAWFIGEELLCGAIPETEKTAAIQALRKGADFIIRQVMPGQRFEDFELYYSCSPKPPGCYDPFSCMYAQNTLAMQWCAEALRTAYLLLDEKKYLDAGLFCLDILCLYQQSWRHPNLDFYSFGGFGVMNTDGEWNDARQAQFAETLSNYYDLTGEFIYLRRAVAATRAGFALMAIDENREVCPRNYQGTARQFEVHGCSAENYGHSGGDERSHQSGFHWGTGSALVTAARMKQRYGDILVDVDSKAAIGIDGVVIKGSRFDAGSIGLAIDCLEDMDSLHIKVANHSGTNACLQVLIDRFSIRNGDAEGEYIALRQH